MSFSDTKNEISKLSNKEIVESLCIQAKKAAYELSKAPIEQINNSLKTIALDLINHKNEILTANAIDVKAAKEKSLSKALIDRLLLNEDRIKAVAASIETVINLNDPTGKVLWTTNRPNGLRIEKISCPIGVLGIIYESRPNVTIDAAILSLKSHNAIILRGGSESFHSAVALHRIIQNALETNDLPKACVSMIPNSDREAVGEMLSAYKYIDVIIPRGGKSLIQRVMNDAKMPVFSHLEGLCHIYIHQSAKKDIAINVTQNAKMRRTGICGAIETLLLDESLDKEISKSIIKNLIDAGCEIVGDSKAQLLDQRINKASKEDWVTEYLQPKLSVRIVNNVKEAVQHINKYGSHHTDSILAEDMEAVSYFQKNVDSGIVMHNASTQFADGGEFGMGAEIGIATGKMHARGPVGLEQLCTYKYLVHGTGQTRPK